MEKNTSNTEIPVAMKKIDVWHFVEETTTLKDGRMHGSRRVYDALQYAPGPWLCRVRVWGDVQEQDDKLVARHREVLDMRDVSAELVARSR